MAGLPDHLSFLLPSFFSFMFYLQCVEDRFLMAWLHVWNDCGSYLLSTFPHSTPPLWASPISSPISLFYLRNKLLSILECGKKKTVICTTPKVNQESTDNSLKNPTNFDEKPVPSVYQMKLCNERQHKIHFGLFIIVKELILENKKHIRSALQLSVHSFSTVSVPLLKRDQIAFHATICKKKPHKSM